MIVFCMLVSIASFFFVVISRKALILANSLVELPSRSISLTVPFTTDLL
jgi:hypothetical protein